MKEITLKFREVEVDGLPEESGFFVARRSEGYQPVELPFSVKHQAFNCFDSQINDDTKIRHVTHWLPLGAFESAFKEDAQDVQALD